MADYITTSNSNLDDITKALEDMNSLDTELLNNSFKRSKSSTSVFKDSNVQSDGEIKKKALFKESIEDDLLFGLLSEEESSLKEKNNAFASTAKNSLMEDLFKIKSPVASATSIKTLNEFDTKFGTEQVEVNQSLTQKPISKSSFTATQNELSPQKLQNVSKNDEDILASLIDDKSDIVEKPKRQRLREKLFEDKLSNIMDSNVPKNVKRMESKFVQFTKNLQESKPDPTDSLTKFSVRESRRGRRNTKIINDPLGLLSSDLLPDKRLELLANENVELVKDSAVQNSKSKEDLPEWLGGSRKLEAKDEETFKTDKVSTSKQDDKIHSINNAIDSKTFGPNESEGASSFPEHFSLLFGAQLNQQNALLNMQQQEHELRTTAILSQQGEQLSKISNTQQSVLHNQEEQFNALLKLQFERQTLLEKQIKMQQERINRYINTLMAQPTTLDNTSSKLNSNETEKKLASEKEEMESRIKILEGEKETLEMKLSTINEKHSNELTFQAEFYERQITFLKEAMTKSEERDKQEMEYLETDYKAKYEKLKDEKLQIENQYKEEIHNLKNEHAQSTEELCKLHSENVKLLQKEYSNIIQSISRAKETEDEVIQTMTGRKTDIENVLQKANIIIENMVENNRILETKANEIKEVQQNSLKMQEDDITTQKLELKHQNNVLTEHHDKFIETTERFNVRLTQVITELQNQSALYNQAQETLEKRTANLLREQDLFEEKMKWERDYIQALKESWMKEQEIQQKLLAEEKKAIATQKAQLEVLSKLKSNSDEIAKIELETAVKTAQEAIASANQEKLKWHEKMNELNLHEQIVQDKEASLVSRAKELENLTQIALIKKQEGMRALKDAKYMEDQNKDKFNHIHMQMQALMDREKRVATEKFNVTRDRMLSLAYEVEKPERDLNISSNFQNDMLIPTSQILSTSEISAELMNMADPNLIRLKLNLSDDYH